MLIRTGIAADADRSCVRACTENGYHALKYSRGILGSVSGPDAKARTRLLRRRAADRRTAIRSQNSLDQLGLDAKLGGGDDWDLHDRLIEGDTRSVPSRTGAPQ